MGRRDLDSDSLWQSDSGQQHALRREAVEPCAAAIGEALHVEDWQIGRNFETAAERRSASSDSNGAIAAVSPDRPRFRREGFFENQHLWLLAETPQVP